LPGDPKECRNHALTCEKLAQLGTTPQARDHFAKLARTWITLAEDLEKSQAFLAAVNEDAEELGQTG
jgi:hypothetical protein